VRILWPTSSLSSRLLLLTVAFVMLSEVLVFVPSISRFRLDFLNERLAAAHLATLALEVTPDHDLSRDLEYELLEHAQAHAIEAYKPLPPDRRSEHDSLVLMLGREMPTVVVDANFDLRDERLPRLIGEAFATLFQTQGRVVQVTGPSPKDPSVLIGIVFDEEPMRMAMLDFAARILVLSLVISISTAGLVFLTLQWLIVRDLRRIAASVTAFRSDPEYGSELLLPSARRDEIGVVEAEIAVMQTDLRASLKQRARLAALGAGMTKIHHDLRSILATARLLTDRLGDSKDEEVRRTSPQLLRAIDRAVGLCGQTLGYAREDLPRPRCRRVPLGELVEEVRRDLSAAWPQLRMEVAIPSDLVLDVDRDQLVRAFTNLVRNAAEAGAGRVTIVARDRASEVTVAVSDDGPGLPPKAQEHLFQPFAGSSRVGGTGLGLPIVQDIMRAHGGDIELLASGPQGTGFLLVFPRERTVFGEAEQSRHLYST